MVFDCDLEAKLLEYDTQHVRSTRQQGFTKYNTGTRTKYTVYDKKAVRIRAPVQVHDPYFRIHCACTNGVGISLEPTRA